MINEKSHDPNHVKICLTVLTLFIYQALKYPLFVSYTDIALSIYI